MLAVQRILIPTDFSDFSERAVRYGCELAAQFGSEVHLIHIFDADTPLAANDWGPPIADFYDDLHNQAVAQLEQVDIAPLTDAGRVTRAVVRGSARTAIENYAQEHNIDLIVMGTHGRTGPAHLLLGSVAEHVVRKAPCAVLTVRNPEHAE